MKRYFGVFLVFIVAAILYSFSFKNYALKLNKNYNKTVIEQSEAFSVIRGFLLLANRKDRVEIEQKVTRRGLDLGYDILLDPNIKLLEVVGTPHMSEREISALVLAYNEKNNEFLHYVLLFINQENNWFLYGFFRQESHLD